MEEEIEEHADPESGATGRDIALATIGEGIACNMKMHPGVVGEMFEELPGGNGPCLGPSNVLDVRDLGFQQVTVFRPEGKADHALVLPEPGGGELILYGFRGGAHGGH